MEQPTVLNSFDQRIKTPRVNCSFSKELKGLWTDWMKASLVESLLWRLLCFSYIILCSFTVLVTLQLGISKILKKPFLNLFGTITDFSIFLAHESITESRVFNIQKMCGPNNHVFFNHKNNFQKLQLHQTLTLLSDFWHMLRS